MENKRNLENRRNLELVKEFLESWLDFADNGFSERTDWVESKFGLCSNIRCWAYEKGHTVEGIDETLQELLYEDFEEQAAYPFGESKYEEDKIYSTHHLNTRRLAWVRKTITKLENLLVRVKNGRF